MKREDINKEVIKKEELLLKDILNGGVVGWDVTTAGVTRLNCDTGKKETLIKDLKIQCTDYKNSFETAKRILAEHPEYKEAYIYVAIQNGDYLYDLHYETITREKEETKSNSNVVCYRIRVPQQTGYDRILKRSFVEDYGIDIKCLTYTEALEIAKWILEKWERYNEVHISSVEMFMGDADCLVEGFINTIKRNEH